MYRTIDTKTWTDKKFKNLSENSRYLFIYLLTNSHSHMSGIYYLPIPFAEHETGYSTQKIKKCFSELIKSNLIKYDADEEILWVVNMCRYRARG